MSGSGAVLWETGPTGGTKVTLDSNGKLSLNDGSGNTKWYFTAAAGSSLKASNGLPVLDDGIWSSVLIPTYGITTTTSKLINFFSLCKTYKHETFSKSHNYNNIELLFTYQADYGLKRPSLQEALPHAIRIQLH